MRVQLGKIAMIGMLTVAPLGCEPRPVTEEPPRQDVRIEQERDIERTDRPAAQPQPGTPADPQTGTGTNVDVGIGGGEGVDVDIDRTQPGDPELVE